MQPPFYYNYINVGTANTNPSGVQVGNTPAAQFFRRYLLQKAMSVFRWTMPRNWVKDYFLYTLYCFGVVAIVKTDKFGVIPQHCTLSGYTVQYQPRNVVISNPLLNGILEPVIDEQCVIFKMTNDFGGIMDLVNYYGDMMAICAGTLAGNIFNSRLAYLFAAKNTAFAESYKKLSDKVLSGEPVIVADKNLFGPEGKLNVEMFSQNLKNNFITPDLMAALRDLENQFATEIGIPNTNGDKRERMIVDEVNANNVETASRCDMWLDNWKESCQKVEKMFGVSVSVDWRVKPAEMGGEQDVQGLQNQSAGTV